MHLINFRMVLTTEIYQMIYLWFIFDLFGFGCFVSIFFFLFVTQILVRVCVCARRFHHPFSNSFILILIFFFASTCWSSRLCLGKTVLANVFVFVNICFSLHFTLRARYGAFFFHDNWREKKRNIKLTEKKKKGKYHTHHTFVCVVE